MIHLFSKRTDSSGFSDEELRAAAQAVRNSMLQSLEETAEPHHTFSESFLRRMQELLRLDQRRNSRRRILQRAAVFLLGVFISGALFLAFNSEARAEFTRWVRTTYENSIFYRFFSQSIEPDSSLENTIPNVEFTWLPGDYDVQVAFSNEFRKTLLLTRGDETLFLIYWIDDDIDFIEVFSDDYVREDAFVNGNKSDFYRATNTETDSVLVWEIDDRIIYSLYSHQPKETIIQIAEGIIEK